MTKFTEIRDALMKSSPEKTFELEDNTMTKKEEELAEKLRYSLPSKSLLYGLWSAAVEIEGKLIYLKKPRDGSVEDPIRWDKRRGFGEEYPEIYKQHVIFGLSMFGRRGHDAIAEYILNN